VTYADLIESLMPFYVRLCPDDPARAFRGAVNWAVLSGGEA
jgi:hypothetical protein